MYITRDVYRLSNFFCAVIVKQEYRYSLMDIFYLCAFQYSLDAKVCKQTVYHMYILLYSSTFLFLLAGYGILYSHLTHGIYISY